MLHHYKIIDKGFNDYNWGTMIYDDTDSSVDIVLNNGSEKYLIEAPPIFEYFLRKGEYRLGKEWAYHMIASRVVPPERPNISDILKGLGLKEYDPIKIFIAIKGRTDYDMLQLEQID